MYVRVSSHPGVRLSLEVQDRVVRVDADEASQPQFCEYSSLSSVLLDESPY